MSNFTAVATNVKNIWERWQPAVHWMFTLLLLLAVGLSQTESGTLVTIRIAISLLSVGLLAWYFIVVRMGERIRAKRLRWLMSYFVAGWLLWYALANLSSYFFFLLFILFPYVFIIVPRPWSILLMVMLNALVLLTLNRMSSELVVTWMLIVGLTTIGSGILGYFVQDIINQSEERRRLIAELQTTRESLAQAQHEAGILSERQRLAGELHDTIAQGFIGIVTNLEAAENATNKNATAASHHLEQAKAIARSSLQETRRFIWAMRSVALEDRAFEDGLRYTLESWSTASNVAANLVVTGAAYVLTPEYEFTILRIIQESLANITKHAGASQATVTLSYTPGAILLDINDDGCGFDPVTSQRRGFGLANMRYRVEQLGGTLAVESELGEGTTLMAHLPFDSKVVNGEPDSYLDRR